MGNNLKKSLMLSQPVPMQVRLFTATEHIADDDGIWTSVKSLDQVFVILRCFSMVKLRVRNRHTTYLFSMSRYAVCNSVLWLQIVGDKSIVYDCKKEKHKQDVRNCVPNSYYLFVFLVTRVCYPLFIVGDFQVMD